MADLLSASNGDWQPGVILYAWSNLASRSACVRDPSKGSNGSAAAFKLLLAWIMKVLYPILGAPAAKLAAGILWLAGTFTAVLGELKRVSAAFLGWQGQPISRHRSLFSWWLLPGLKVWHVSLGVILAGGLLYRCVRVLLLLCDHTARRTRSVMRRMDEATSFEEWETLASELDSIRGQTQLGPRLRDGKKGLFDAKLLSSKVAELDSARARGNVDGLMFSIRSDLYRDFGNITNRQIHHHYHILPAQIRQYIDTVNSCLEYIANADAPELQHRLSFFQETRHAFGRSALVLSGGGSLGAFHLGIVRGLLERGLLPRIIAGSSVGSIVAALAAVHTDDELRTMYSNMNTFNLSFFANNSTFAALFHLFRKGSLQDVEFLKKRLRAMLSDVTFLDAYQRTNRFLNVTVTAADTNEPPRMLNYLTAPHVVIWSAVAASSAFPGLFPPQDILARDPSGNFVGFATEATAGVKRRWHDGSLENDLPFRQLAEMFNVNHFIVGQTNPHLVPLMSLRKVVPGAAFDLLQAEVKHVFVQAQTYLPAWVPTKWMSLFTQAWEGDVTILLPWKAFAKNISKAMYNPTAADLIEADALGRKAVWERMSAIQGNCAIELKLDQCLSRVAEVNAQAPDCVRRTSSRGAALAAPRSAGRSGRIPSWWHLPTLSLAAGFIPAVKLGSDGSSRGTVGQAGAMHSGVAEPAVHSSARRRRPQPPDCSTLPEAEQRAQPGTAAGCGDSQAKQPVAHVRRGSAPHPHATSASQLDVAAQPPVLDAAGRHAASAPASPTGLAITSASSSSDDREIPPHSASAATAMAQQGAHGAPADATLGHPASSIASPAGSVTAADSGGAVRHYGATPGSARWRGVGSLALTIPQQSNGMGSRELSGYALDVMAP